jgi:hypothetical protein
MCAGAESNWGGACSVATPMTKDAETTTANLRTTRRHKPDMARPTPRAHTTAARQQS